MKTVIAAVVLAACVHADRRMGPPDSLSPARAQTTPAPQPPAARRVEFGRDVRPILEARCQPCHFQGGIMYEKLPFDREATIRTLGTRLFTRIKAADEQRVIREFLSQGN